MYVENRLFVLTIGKLARYSGLPYGVIIGFFPKTRIQSPDGGDYQSRLSYALEVTAFWWSRARKVHFFVSEKGRGVGQ